MSLIKRPLVTIAILIIAFFLNDYLLENVFFTGNSYKWVSVLFSTVEIIFLSYCLTMVIGLKGLIRFFKSILSKDKEGTEPVEATHVSWPIQVASVLYGIFAGVIVYFPTDGYSFFSCLLSCTALSIAWGFVYLFFWKRGDLLWLLNWLYVEEHESDFEREDRNNMMD
jgi:hypothetical protein